MCAGEYGPAALTTMGSAAASMPSTAAVPKARGGGNWQLSICMGVVLPALPGPKKPKNLPCAIWRLSLSTAVCLPNRFVRACASIEFNVSPTLVLNWFLWYIWFFHGI